MPVEAQVVHATLRLNGKGHRTGRDDCARPGRRAVISAVTADNKYRERKRRWWRMEGGGGEGAGGREIEGKAKDRRQRKHGVRNQEKEQQTPMR